MEKQYKLSDRVSKDSIKSPTFKKWLKRVLCFVCIMSLALQLTLCCIPMHASAEESVSLSGTWVFNDTLIYDFSDPLYGAVLLFNYECNGVQYSSFMETSQYARAKVYYATSPSITENNVVYRATYPDGPSSWVNNYYRTITITSDVVLRNSNGTDVTSSFLVWLQANATKVIEEVYDFTGEYRLFNEQLTNLSFSQAGTVTQSYAFDFNIWGGYNADYFHVQADGSSVDISYAFTDYGSGGIKTVYRQLLRDGEIVGTWLVPRARLIYFQSNPDDPTFQQWLLDNTVLIDESMIDSVYSFGYDHGFNDGWTNSAIGDTLKAPVEALNSIVLLDVAGVTITLGGVIFTMVVLSMLLIFLKKYAGG